MSTTLHASRRAAAYLRVSLDSTGEGLAVDRQRESCLSIIAARGWELVETYTDNSISATDARRIGPATTRWCLTSTLGASTPSSATTSTG